MPCFLHTAIVVSSGGDSTNASVPAESTRIECCMPLSEIIFFRIAEPIALSANIGGAHKEDIH